MANPKGINQYTGKHAANPAVGLSKLRTALRAAVFQSRSGLKPKGQRISAIAWASPITKAGTQSKKFPEGYVTSGTYNGRRK